MKRGLVGVLISLATLPLVSALTGGPLDYLTNEWVKFFIIFILLFVSIYSFLNKKMQNAPVAVVIALGLSALISIPIMQRGLLDPLLGPNIVDWIIISALAIAVIFLFYKFGMRLDNFGRRRFSWPRFIFFLVLVVLVIYIIGENLPDSILIGPIGDWIDIIKGLGITSVAIIGLVLVGFVLIRWFWRRHTRTTNYYLEGRYKAAGARGLFGGRNPGNANTYGGGI